MFDTRPEATFQVGDLVRTIPGNKGDRVVKSDRIARVRVLGWHSDRKEWLYFLEGENSRQRHRWYLADDQCREPANDNQPEKRVGCVIADLHDGQIVFLSKRLNHFMRSVMIDFGAIIYIDKIRFTKALITFIKGELKIIGLSHSQKDFEFIINGLLEEVDNTTSMIEPDFLTETAFCHEASQFRNLLVQSHVDL